MAAINEELQIILKAQDQTSAAFNGLNRNLNSLKDAAVNAAKVIAGAFVLDKLVDGIKDVANAAMEEQASMARLGTAVANAGGVWSNLRDSIEGTIASMERTTAFSDNELRDALSLLVAETGDVGEAMNRLPIAADFARGANLDLATSAKLLGKVTDDTVNVLGRYGIHVQKGADATEVLALVQQKFSGQAATFADTAAGKMQVFSTQMENLKEKMGTLLLPIIGDLASKATTAIDILGEMFGVITGQSPSAGATLRSALGDPMAEAIMGALANVRESFKKLFSGDIPGFIEDVKAAIGGWIEHLRTIDYDQLGQTLAQWGLAFGDWVVNSAIPALIENMPKIMLAIAKFLLVDAPLLLGGALLQFGKGMAEKIGEAFMSAVNSIWSAIVYAITAAINQIDFWIGPFHITGHGISFNLPTGNSGPSSSASNDQGNIAFGISPTASGGIVTGPQIRLVGEAGPEAIIPLNQAQGIGQTVYLTVNVTGNVTNSEDELAEKIGNRLMSDMLSQRLVAY